MPITDVQNTSIFEMDVAALVNPVNCEGAMGSGLAKSFRALWPKMFYDYYRFCKSGQLTIGTLHTWVDPDSGLIIVNLPTKNKWMNGSRLEYVEAGLIALRELIVVDEIESIAIPMLGCGLGGLNWEYEVKPLLYDYLADVNCNIYVLE